MKRFFTNISILTCLALAIASCNKTAVGDFVPNPPLQQNDTTWFTNDTIVPITSSLDKPVTTDSFNCISSDDASKISIGDSVTITFPSGGCMTTQNKPSTTITAKSAKVKANILVLTSKGDVIRHKVPTTSNGNLLNFGAYVNIKLTYKGNPIFWNTALQKQIQIRVRTKDHYPTLPMQYFMYQADTTGKDTLWLPLVSHGPVYPTYIGGGSSNSPNNGYLITTNKIGWFGCANSIPSSPYTTRINIFLPINFTNKNTVTYAVFNDTKTVVRLKPNPLGKSYGASGIPINANITLVSISKIDGIYYWATKQITATSSNPIKLTPASTDLSNIEQYLRSL